MTNPATNNDLQTHFDQAMQYQKAGRFAEAETIYKQILSADPHHAESLHMLGLIAFNTGRYEEAENFIRKAIFENNNIHTFHNNLGTILKVKGKLEDAVASYKHALTIKHDFADCLANLGATLSFLGKNDEALAFCKKAIEVNPNHFNAINSAGTILFSQKKYEDAAEYYKRALSVKPDANTFLNLGNIYKENGKLETAAEQYIQASKLMPTSHQILNNLGTLYTEMRKHDEAVEYYNRALTLQPNNSDIIRHLAATFLILGKLEDALFYYKKALSLSPQDPYIYSDLLLTMVYASSVTPIMLTEAAKYFGKNIADPLLRQRLFLNDKNPDRKIRIGYVSPDFREHPVNYFFEPLLNLHNHEKFEIFAYSNVSKEDAITQRLKSKFDHWRNIYSISDDAVADMIEHDQIDILIDLAGHTGGSRIMVFARKPAPVQVTWLGYPATTGMKAMDYRITDVHAEPPGMTEHLNVEKLWRLPEVFCCYQSHENSPDVIDHPPFEDNDYITFGCFNSFAKVTDSVLTVWAQILTKVPNSKLLLEITGVDNPKFRAETEERFKSLMLPMDRIILEPRKKSNQFVLYNKIDIALDPFPCVGGTTSMDTLWMGVPFVTLAGEHFVSRMGVTILKNAGLSELIAEDFSEYVERAIQLANNKEKLKEIRRNLRTKFSTSPVMNQQNFARNMEAAYTEMWKRYCNLNSK